MKQVIQSYRSGQTSLADIPAPIAKDHCVLIHNHVSMISAGTEKMVIDLARKSLLGKARERPDQVRRVLQKMKQEGLLATLSQVSAKLDEPLPLGYSSAGTVLAIGKGVQRFKPGDRVASNGPHAEIVCVPELLCAHIPEGVPWDQAGFTVLGSIAMQGVRLAKVGLADTVFVIGLGLIGQIAVQLLKAQGCLVFGTDPDLSKCDRAVQNGAIGAGVDLTAQDISNFTRGLGADAVLITAATSSDEPVKLAGEAVRKKGRVVVVGAVGLNLSRRDFYFKEAELVVSSSYGPGRYDPNYEERAQDYPAAHVRWTEQRNLQAVLDLLGAGRIDFSSLISHRFRIEEALNAYDLIESNREPYLGILLQYPDQPNTARKIQWSNQPMSGAIGVGCIGTGQFARATLLPALVKNTAFSPQLLCSATGLSAAETGRKLGFKAVTSDENDVFADETVKAVFVLTRHNQHAAQTLRAIRENHPVFVEKPLALSVEELTQIESALQESKTAPILMVGFNRRFAPACRQMHEFFADTGQPLTVFIRFNAGEIPADHWTQDEETGGGRIIGEACHAIDLATFLTGSFPTRVYAESVGGPNAKAVTDDQCFITLRHANGSVSNIAYLAGGDRSFPKERVEVLGGGRIAVLDDFRALTTCAGGQTRHQTWRGQDKGHAAELVAFAESINRGGPPPVSWESLRAVTLASILAVQSIREGTPFDIP